MRILFSCLLFCCALLSWGQSLKFKANLDENSMKKLWVEGQGVEVRVEGGSEKIKLVVKNTSKEYFVVEADEYSLIHNTGIKDKLCGPVLKIGPGEKESITLTLCDQRQKEGLFGLKSSYDSKESFEEQTLFIVDKQFKLQLGDSLVDFYTAR